jgi:hypothetical protein
MKPPATLSGGQTFQSVDPACSVGQTFQPAIGIEGDDKRTMIEMQSFADRDAEELAARDNAIRYNGE